MYIDFKKTIWERIQIPKELEPFLKENLGKAPLKNILNSILYDDVRDDVDSEEIYETEEIMTPEQNSNNATIEVYDNGNCVYSNSKSN